jgi:hypothetical protein
MQLELQAKLPARAKLFWEMPLAFLDQLPGRLPHAIIDLKHKVARVSMRPSGDYRLPAVLFPARSRTRMRLLAAIPKDLRDARYQLAVRQLWEDQEVGRVTWILAPDVRRRKGKKEKEKKGKKGRRTRSSAKSR